MVRASWCSQLHRAISEQLTPKSGAAPRPSRESSGAFARSRGSRWRDCAPPCNAIYIERNRPTPARLHCINPRTYVHHFIDITRTLAVANAALIMQTASVKAGAGGPSLGNRQGAGVRAPFVGAKWNARRSLRPTMARRGSMVTRAQKASGCILALPPARTHVGGVRGRRPPGQCVSLERT